MKVFRFMMELMRFVYIYSRTTSLDTHLFSSETDRYTPAQQQQPNPASVRLNNPIELWHMYVSLLPQVAEGLRHNSLVSGAGEPFEEVYKARFPSAW
jgi:hypothetical protein